MTMTGQQTQLERMAQMDTEVLTIPKVREYLVNEVGMTYPPTEQALYRWCFEGIDGWFLPHMRVGSRVLVRKDDIHKFLEVALGAL